MITKGYTEDTLNAAFDRIRGLLNSDGSFQPEDAQAIYDGAFEVGRFCLDLASCIHHGIAVDEGRWQDMRAHLEEKFKQFEAKRLAPRGAA